MSLITSIVRQIQTKQDELDALREMLAEEKRILISNIVVTRRKASTVLSREDGLSIVVSAPNATHRERTIFWYDGKKGQEIERNSRMNIREWSIWLAQYENVFAA